MKDVIILEKIREKKPVKKYYKYNSTTERGLSIKSY